LFIQKKIVDNKVKINNTEDVLYQISKGFTGFFSFFFISIFNQFVILQKILSSALSESSINHFFSIFSCVFSVGFSSFF